MADGERAAEEPRASVLSASEPSAGRGTGSIGSWRSAASSSTRSKWVGRSLRPGVYFRLMLIGYFEGMDRERGIAWRAADSLAAAAASWDTGTGRATRRTTRRSRATRRLIDVETHQEVFGWVLERLAEAGLLKGKTIGVDATTLEANAAMRSIVRRDTGETYEEFLTRLGEGGGDRDADAGSAGAAGSAAQEEGLQRRLEEPARSGCARSRR